MLAGLDLSHIAGLPFGGGRFYAHLGLPLEDCFYAHPGLPMWNCFRSASPLWDRARRFACNDALFPQLVHIAIRPATGRASPRVITPVPINISVCCWGCFCSASPCGRARCFAYNDGLFRSLRSVAGGSLPRILQTMGNESTYPARTKLHPRIRLKGFDYTDPDAVYFVTIRASEGSRPFVGAELPIIAVEQLDGLRSRFGVSIYAFTVMPDHVHALVRLETGNHSLGRVFGA